MSLRAGGSARTQAADGTGTSAGGPVAVRVVAVAVAATLLVLAVLVASAWQSGQRPVVLEMPAPPSGPAPAAGSERGGAGNEPAGDSNQGEDPAGGPADNGEAEGETQAEIPVSAGFGDPAFFETPMRVLRRSNIRARPTPDSTARGRADVGTMVILVDPKPERGYFRVATGELDGWIWGANLEPADTSQQPDAPDALPPPADGSQGRPGQR